MGLFLAHFVLYGALGWCVEVTFTGLSALFLHGDRTATGRTYLWMHPIYGLGGLAFEGLAHVLTPLPIPIRIVAYLAAVYVAEYVSGFVLRRAIGRCPWDYGLRRWSIHGLIRLDYAPYWLVLCILIEPAQAWARTIFGG